MLKQRVDSVLEKAKKMHINDPAIYKLWEELIKLLSGDEKKTIHYLNQCNEEDILAISSVFEDVAERFKSKPFIQALKDIQIKYSKLDLKYSIDMAIKYSQF